MKAVGLIIDVQQGIVGNLQLMANIAQIVGALLGEDTKPISASVNGLVDNIGTTIHALTKHHVPLLCVARSPQSTIPLNVAPFHVVQRSLVAHNPQEAFMPLVADNVAHDVAAVVKRGASALENPHVRSFIRHHRADTVLLVGFTEYTGKNGWTQCCVTRTAEAAGKLGLKPIIIAGTTNSWITTPIRVRRRLHGRHNVGIEPLRAILPQLERR